MRRPQGIGEGFGGTRKFPISIVLLKAALTPGPWFPLTQEQNRKDFLFLYDFLKGTG